MPMICGRSPGTRSMLSNGVRLSYLTCLPRALVNVLDHGFNWPVMGDLRRLKIAEINLRRERSSF
jgi:hypothetical protein